MFIRLLKGDAAVAQGRERIPRNELGVPAIVLYELEYGSLKARFSGRLSRIHNLHVLEIAAAGRHPCARKTVIPCG